MGDRTSFYSGVQTSYFHTLRQKFWLNTLSRIVRLESLGTRDCLGQTIKFTEICKRLQVPQWCVPGLSASFSSTPVLSASFSSTPVLSTPAIVCQYFYVGHCSCGRTEIRSEGLA